jgi:hypothetical protein
LSAEAVRPRCGLPRVLDVSEEGQKLLALLSPQLAGLRVQRIHVRRTGRGLPVPLLGRIGPPLAEILTPAEAEYYPRGDVHKPQRRLPLPRPVTINK